VQRTVVHGSWERVMRSCGIKFQMAAKFAAAHTLLRRKRQHGTEHVKKRPFRRFRRH
jgi:hypothetical protein